MGCLNSSSSFTHWFGNIHLSGPCNRRCYFCIGQHMMALDAENTLDTYPLPGLDAFIEECRARDVTEVCVTGTNTDPLLYRHTPALTARLRRELPGVPLALRTNAAAWRTLGERARWYDKGSVTLCSFDSAINQAMMGGDPPILEFILTDAYLEYKWKDLKVNVVLGPENHGDDLLHTLDRLADLGVERVNLREPYGQPRVADPLAAGEWEPFDTVHGMPVYLWRGTMRVTYWDVHYCEVESVNLYASGRVSTDYPITRGHAPGGAVQDQSHFPGGRVRPQWLHLPVVSP